MKHKQKFSNPDGNRLSLILAVVAIVAFAASLIWWIVHRTDLRLREELLQEARIASSAIDSRSMAMLSGSDYDLRTPNYVRLKEQLNHLRHSCPKCRYLYLMGRKQDGTIFFYVDSEPSESEGCSPPGQTFDEASQLLRDVFATGSEAVEGPLEDRWGTWVSALVPISDPRTGSLTAVFGMDVDAAGWKWAVLKDSAYSLGLTIFTLIVALLVLRLKRVNQRSQQLSLKLIESERQIGAILNSISDGIISIDPAGNVASMNPVAEKLTGWTSLEAKGRPIRKIFNAQIIGDAPETILTARDGTDYKVAISLGLNRDTSGTIIGSLLIAHDVTAECAAAAALDESRKAVETIIQSLLCGVMVIQAETHMIIDVNPAACKMLGRPFNDIVGRECHRFVCPAEKGSCPIADKCQIVENADRVITRPDGTIVSILKSVKSITLNGRPCLLESFIDISDRKCAEAELLSHSMELERTKLALERNAAYLSNMIGNLAEARDTADTANRAKGDFLAKMSHEIRTPMNAIIGMTELVLDSELNQSQREYLKMVLESSENLLSIINDILDFSKIEAGKMTLEKVEFSLHEVVNSVIRLLSHRADAKCLKLTTNIRGGSPDKILGDPTRLRQVLINIVGNAIKFTEQGEINIVIDTENKEDSIHFHFSVADTGIGIPEHMKSRIFESFTQSEVSITRRYGGTGLGTTISKQLVEAMGGSIWLESPTNHKGVGGPGATFHFILPFAAAPESVDQIASEKPQSVESIALRNNDAEKRGTPNIEIGANGTVLLAEDDKFNAILAKKLLENMGFEVVIAGDGQQALDRFQPEEFRLVFMDIFMPIKDGFEATRGIREKEKQSGSRTPIIAMTALASENDRQACLQAGMDGYISKPIRKDELMSSIDSLTGILSTDSSN